MSDPSLRADCAQCAALCCVSLAFDCSTLFAVDKPAGVPCPHLDEGHGCAIHAELDERGFAGCARYDCLGAGQHVVQQVFGGRSWKTEPALARPMFEAFRVMRRVHELLLLLRTAKALPLTQAEARRCEELRARLQPAEGWSVALLDAFDRSATDDEVQAFLATLRDPAVAAAGLEDEGARHARSKEPQDA